MRQRPGRQTVLALCRTFSNTSDVKQSAKFLALFAVLMAASLGLIGYLGLGVRGVGDQVRKTSLATEARILLLAMRSELDARHQRHAVYPARLTLNDTNGVTRERYSAGVVNSTGDVVIWWGDPGLKEVARELCPDCVLTPEGYKLIALGNVDDDPDLDVWIQRSDEDKPVHWRAD